MSYRIQDIDRAIVMTQADLRGFYHPMGLRVIPTAAKFVFYTTINLPAFMAGISDENHETDETYVSADSKATYEQHVIMAKAMAEACNVTQVEAIDLILRSIVRKMNTYRKEREAGILTSSEGYIYTRDKTNIWGITVLSMREGFKDKFKLLRKFNSEQRKAFNS